MKKIDKEQIPQDPHYAILEYRSIEIPGYDRYDPSTTEQVFNYFYTFDKEEWENEIKRILKLSNGPKIVPMVVTPAKIVTDISIQV